MALQRNELTQHDMLANKYIQKTREYLDYLENHIENVRKAYNFIVAACHDMAWTQEPRFLSDLDCEIGKHDVSKLGPQEFTQYRDYFYPVSRYVKDNSNFDMAWEHHKKCNLHHHQALQKSTHDIIHMVVDWTAMSYVFGGTAQSYYEANTDRITLKPIFEGFMYELFRNIEKYDEKQP